MDAITKRRGDRIIVVFIALLVLVLLAQVAMSYFSSPQATVHIGDGKFTARIADTDKERIRGLSGTSSLPHDHAMVFVFDENGRHGIWMKDMNYSIDVVWLNESKQVVDFVTNVPPESYPNRTFVPKEDARYILEFNSGTVKAEGIRVGSLAIFSGANGEL